MKTVRQLCSLLLGLVFIAVACFAQAPVGDVSGTIYDESGAIVPNVPTTVVNKETGLSRTVNSNSEGVFSVSALPAGVYDVKVEIQGFRTLIRQATVT